MVSDYTELTGNVRAADTIKYAIDVDLVDGYAVKVT